jgi:flavodoxin
VQRLKSVLIVFFSNTGNTQKAAYAIKEGFEKEGLRVDLKKLQEAAERRWGGENNPIWTH